MSDMSRRNSQRGVFLLEVLIAIVIFAIGILAMISMQAVSIAAQNDSQYRAEAEHLIDQLTSQMRMAVAHDTTTGNVVASQLRHLCPSGDHHQRCNYTGAVSTVDFIEDWINTVKGFASDGTTKIAGKGLPGVTDARVQIQTDSATMPGMNQVRVTLCWQAANDKTSHSHSVVAYID
jgi:type IV pilus assembly protein PilV